MYMCTYTSVWWGFIRLRVIRPSVSSRTTHRPGSLVREGSGDSAKSAGGISNNTRGVASPLRGLVRDASAVPGLQPSTSTTSSINSGSRRRGRAAPSATGNGLNGGLVADPLWRAGTRDRFGQAWHAAVFGPRPSSDLARTSHTANDP